MTLSKHSLKIEGKSVDSSSLSSSCHHFRHPDSLHCIMKLSKDCLNTLTPDGAVSVNCYSCIQVAVSIPRYKLHPFCPLLIVFMLHNLNAFLPVVQLCWPRQTQLCSLVWIGSGWDHQGRQHAWTGLSMVIVPQQPKI